MNVITIGGATQDIFIQNNDAQTVEFHQDKTTQSFLLLPEGAKLEIDSLCYKTGGGCTNSATSFKQLGLSATLFCKIGADHQGHFILDELKQAGLPTDLIVQSSDVQTGTSFVIPSPNGDSSILAYRGANATLKKNEIPFDKLKNNNAYYITSLSGESSHLLELLTEHAKKQGTLVANNPGMSQLSSGAESLRKSLKNIDILILNAHEAQIFMKTLVETEGIGKPELHPTQTQSPFLLQNLLTYQDMCFSITHFFKEVSNQGPQTIVVTNGKEGVYVFNNNTIYFHKSLDTHLVNTLGAGDAFGSCFVGSILKGKSISQSMINGIINASSVISYLDAKEGLLNWSQLEKKSMVVGTKGIQTFSL